MGGRIRHGLEGFLVAVLAVADAFRKSPLERLLDERDRAEVERLKARQRARRERSW